MRPYIVIGAICCIACSSFACDSRYPEIVVVNKIGEDIMIRNISFNGCLWEDILVYEDATSPGSCLDGEDRVHFQLFDPAWYAVGQVEDGDGIEASEAGPGLEAGEGDETITLCNCEDAADDGDEDEYTQASTYPADTTSQDDGISYDDIYIKTPEPVWYNYMTVKVYKVDYDDFRLFELRVTDMQQDFDAPSAFGH